MTAAQIEEALLTVGHLTAKELATFEVYLSIEAESSSEPVGKLGGSIKITSSFSGNLQGGKGALAAEPIKAVSAFRANLQAPGKLAGRVASTSALKGALQAAGSLRGRLTSASTLSGGLQGLRGTLAGTISSVSAFKGSLAVPRVLQTLSGVVHPRSLGARVSPRSLAAHIAPRSTLGVNSPRSRTGRTSPRSRQGRDGA